MKDSSNSAMLKRTLFLLVLLFSLPALGAQSRYAFLAGGSGEFEGKNFFLDDLADFRKSLIARGWDVSVVAGPGGLPAPFAAAATGPSIVSGLKRTLSQAEKGDQVLVLFHSHGNRRETDWGQRSHSIVTERADPSASDGSLDLDRIEPLVQKASARGARIALVDLSCYSGASQALKGPACTVTLASRNYVSLCSGRPEEKLFGAVFLKLPEPGKPISLEAKFLEARRLDKDTVNLPRISSRTTPALAGWEAFLEGLDPLDVSEHLKDARKTEKTFDPAALLGAIDEALKTKYEDRKTSDDRIHALVASELKRALEVRQKLEARIPAMAEGYDELKFELSLSSGEKFRLSAASLSDMLEKSGEDPKEVNLEGWTDVQRHRLEAIRPMRTALEKRFAKALARFRKNKEDFELLMGELEATAGAVMTREREIYDTLSGAETGKSGCGEFAL